MCSSKPPEPTAPPAPTPTRAIQQDARSETQDRVQKANRSSYASTIVAPPLGIDEEPVTVSKMGA
jgi:hypothetical protein